jgi:hypothetical protein
MKREILCVLFDSVLLPMFLDSLEYCQGVALFNVIGTRQASQLNTIQVEWI